MQILRCHLIKPREIHSGFSEYSGFSIENIWNGRYWENFPIPIMSNFKTENNSLLYRNAISKYI